MPYRILVVDDEPAIRQTLPQILAHHGFDVSSAGTVAEALAEIAGSPLRRADFRSEHRPARRWFHRGERHATHPAGMHHPDLDRVSGF